MEPIVTVHTRVRKDGALNITKKARIALGLKPFSEIDISIADGTCVIRPTTYHCAVCKCYYDEPLDNAGVCTSCNNAIVEALSTKKVKTLADAIDYARVKGNKAKVGKKV